MCRQMPDIRRCVVRASGMGYYKGKGRRLAVIQLRMVEWRDQCTRRTAAVIIVKTEEEA